MKITRDIEENVAWEKVPCDLCGAGEGVPWARARGNILTRCPDCGLVWTNPRIADREFRNRHFYGEDYFFQEDRMTDEMRAARSRAHAMERAKLETMKSCGRILEVGCGMGIFLGGFGNAWEKYGCDISSFALQEAAKRGITTFQGEFESLDPGPLLFDVVYFRAALHHTFSPMRCLARASELLTNDGLIAICMCSIHSGLMGRLFRGHVRSYDQALNYLFSEETLEAYLAKAGCAIIEKDYPFLGTGYGSWSDLARGVPDYMKYLVARAAGRENEPHYRDLASPAFHGNYINVYARKVIAA